MRLGTAVSAFFFCVLSALLLAGCGSDDSPPPEPLFYRWGGFPVPLSADPSLLDRGAREADLRAAMSFWEGKAGKTLFQLGGAWRDSALPFTGDPTDPSEIRANAILFYRAWNFGTQEAGFTVVLYQGNAITGGDILLDPQTPVCTGLCTGLLGDTSLRRLLAHELGHFLGLAHSQDPMNIMYPTIQSGGSLDDRTVDLRALLRSTD